MPSSLKRDVVAGLDWIIAEHKRRQSSTGTGTKSIANLSLGGFYSAFMNDAVRRTTEAGIAVVAAAGNSDDDACFYSPAAEPTAITVGSTTDFPTLDERSWFSNYGSCLDTFAPGSSITSAGYESDTGVLILSGTSMAAPRELCSLTALSAATQTHYSRNCLTIRVIHF